jgi:hypothetical protein
MNLQEAQKVLWLKSNPRPLGELMDEGYLTTERLEWAAQWAYSAKLKEAAKLILESIYHGSITRPIDKPQAFDAKAKDPGIEIGIALDKARTTAWPFPPYKGQPMGALVESKQLSLKDLGYAAENAWDPKVRQAAIAFSLMRLDQAVKEPIPSAGFVHVISGGRSFAEQKQLRLSLRQGAILGAFLTILFVLLTLIITNGIGPSTASPSSAAIVFSPAVIVAIIIVVGLTILIGWFIGFVFDKIINRLDKQIEEHRRGQEGEEKVVQLILQALDGNWCLFRNINLPGRNKGDLDLVLVGPPGVWVLEVKNFRGEYRNIGGNWEYRNGKTWRVAFANPSKQAVNNAYRLKNFLKADNVNAFVNSAIIWANSENPLTIENPAVAVWQYNRMPDELGNIWQGERLSGPVRNRIEDKLIKLCEKSVLNHS